MLSLKPNGKNHDGCCKFTPEGSICRTTVRNLVQTLTGSEIKALAALDDVKVLKGRENWIRARKIAIALFGKDTDEAKEMIERIDKQETYYHTDFVPHLFRVSNNKCNCFTCGFSDEGKIIWLVVALFLLQAF